MLVPMHTLMKTARANGYAVGAFDVNNLELGLGVIDAAIEKNSPVILLVPEWGPNGCVPLEALFSALAVVAKDAPIPVALTLDHGRSLEACVRALKGGATGVMLDASTKTHEENISLTKRAVEIGHWAGASVEGEIGHVGQGSDYGKADVDLSALYTKPEEAVEFVEKTGVDCLAVAVGTAHGSYAGTPKIEFELLKRIAAAVPTPLVLHGGSSSGDTNLAKAATLGVAKVNIYTDMAVAARDRVVAMLGNDPKKVPYMKMLLEGKAAFKDVAMHYMDVFGSTGKLAGYQYGVTTANAADATGGDH
jgi:fructose-bisphosphate aldolase class II